MSSKKTETRIRILEATWSVLEAKGGHGARMGDIAKAAGISRQAVYLHFTSRADLLAATTTYIDDRLDLERRLAPSREAGSGIERLDAYIRFWGNYVPEIYNVAKALLSVQDTDEAAAAAWHDRMLALRDGCRAAIEALQADDNLAGEWNVKRATDLLWTILSVRNWEQLTQECGLSRRQYIFWMQVLARRSFVDGN